MENDQSVLRILSKSKDFKLSSNDRVYSRTSLVLVVCLNSVDFKVARDTECCFKSVDSSLLLTTADPSEPE